MTNEEVLECMEHKKHVYWYDKIDSVESFLIGHIFSVNPTMCSILSKPSVGNWIVDACTLYKTKKEAVIAFRREKIGVV